MRHYLDEELPPCVGEKMRDIAHGLFQEPRFIQPPKRVMEQPRRCGKQAARAKVWEFYRWASSLGRVPTAKEISEKLEMSTSTAYIWRTQWINYYTPDKRISK